MDYFKSDVKHVSSSQEETFAIGRLIAQHLTPGSIVCLEGSLGAGKTSLAKGIIASLTNTPHEEIQSPTFIFLNLYTTPQLAVCHFDVYRLQHPQEFEERGFLDYFDKTHLCLIEWSSKILPLIPKDSLHIHISQEGQNQRIISCKRGS